MRISPWILSMRNIFWSSKISSKPWEREYMDECIMHNNILDCTGGVIRMSFATSERCYYPEGA